MHSPLSVSVLVVGDDPDSNETTVRLLNRPGFSASAASGGREAVESAAADPPDVALIDLCMTDMDGYEVARRITDSSPGKPPILIALTEFASDWDRERAQTAGFALYLVKPVPPDELVTVVRQCGQARGSE
jgi:CheY-like chemotaxis protein